MARKCHYLYCDRSGRYYCACDGRTYLCHAHHRSSSFLNSKSQWVLTRPEECHLFCQACLLKSEEGALGYWFISRGGKRIFGTRQERVAFFEAPQNQTDPWHGYPVSGARRGAGHRPPPEVVTSWQESGWVPKHVADKIRRCVI